MNLPNLLTLSRVPLLFVIAALMSFDWTGAATAALLVFIIAGITDWLDGAVARRRGLVSDFGKLMDALTDKILVVGLMVAVVVFGLAPWPTVFLVLLVLTREFLITGMRMMAVSRGIISGPGNKRRSRKSWRSACSWRRRFAGWISPPGSEPSNSGRRPRRSFPPEGWRSSSWLR